MKPKVIELEDHCCRNHISISNRHKYSSRVMPLLSGGID